MVDRQASRQQKYLQKQGLTLLPSAAVRYQLQFRLDVINLAFSCYLQIQVFNQHLFRAGRSMNLLPSQILERWLQCFSFGLPIKSLIEL